MPAPIARKRFGQNFLRDPGVVAKIIAAIDVGPEEHLVEIGPGTGAITAGLQSRAARLTLVEVDRDLAAALADRFAHTANVVIHCADALRFDFSALGSAEEKIRVAGNLPYNISSPLLFHLIELRRRIADMHFMLQSEVVDRMVAAPNDPSYGRLSVMLRYACSAERLFRVPPGAFHPVPKVHSAFVRLVPWDRPPVEVGDEGHFRRLVTRAFGQRRKTLRNALHGTVPAHLIERCGIDPARRPGTLSLEEFATLARLSRARGRA